MDYINQYSSSSCDSSPEDSKESKDKSLTDFFSLKDEDDDDDEEEEEEVVERKEEYSDDNDNSRKKKKNKNKKQTDFAVNTNSWFKCPRQNIPSFKINDQGNSISLPSDAFWKDISEEEISRPANLKHHFIEAVSNKETSSETQSEVVVEPSQSICCKRLNLIQESFDTKAYTSKKQKLNKTTENQEVTVGNLPKTENPEKNKRKIFFVHGKIAPHQANMHHAQNQIAKKRETSMQAHSGAINRIQWCIPQYSHLLLSAADDSQVKIWNMWSQFDPCVQIFRNHSKCVKDAKWSSCGRQVLTCGYDRTAVISDVETGCALQVLPHQHIVPCASYHPLNTSLVLTGSKNTIYSWDLRTPQEPVRKYDYKDNMGTIQDLLFSRNGEIFFSCCDVVSQDSSDRNIMAWHHQSGVVLSNQIYHEKYTCTRLRLHPTENVFLAHSHGGYVALFSAKSPFKMDKSKRFDSHKLMSHKIGFDVSADGRFVVAGCSDGQIYSYHFYNGVMLKALNTQFGVSMDVACHPVLPTSLACCSSEGQIQIWH
ncbi:WD repeat-containing protein 25-like [Argonauta hians]